LVDVRSYHFKDIFVERITFVVKTDEFGVSLVFGILTHEDIGLIAVQALYLNVVCVLVTYIWREPVV
jgi:hypothetical protein